MSEISKVAFVPVAAALVFAACASPSSVAPSRSEIPTATASIGSSIAPSEAPTAVATPLSTPSRPPLPVPAVSASCPAAQTVRALVLATPIGAPDGVVGLFDARDPRAPKVLCVLAMPDGRFVSATDIEYTRILPRSAEIVRRDLLSGDERAIIPPGRVTAGFGGIVHAWGRDGKTLVYLAPADPMSTNGCPCTGNSVHLISGGTDRVLAYFGEIPARGFTAHGGDQVAASFSPNGSKFVAVDTISGSSSQGEAKSLRVYSFDGRPLLETSGTMPVWVGERLLFRGCRYDNPPACVSSWDGGPISTVLPAVLWEDPVVAVGSQLVAFSRWDDACVGCVVLYDAGANTLRTLGNLRSRPIWVSATVIWWTEEDRCDYPSCNMPAPTIPTDRMDSYDLTSGTEAPLPFSRVYDVWPGA